MTVKIRIVLDTNVLVRALADDQSFSGRLVAACEARLAIPLLSKPLLAEYRRVLVRAAEYNQAIRAGDYHAVLAKLMYLGEYTPVNRTRFYFARDPTDAKLIELAISGRATHLATYDRDLLSLPSATTDAAKRFRQRLASLRVMMPAELIRENPQLRIQNG